MTFLPGGEIAPDRIVDLRKQIGELAHPGEPPVANSALFLRVLSLGNDTVAALRRNLTSKPPINAKEMTLRQFIIERSALLAPKETADWIMRHGDEPDRRAMPLALFRLALIDADAAFEFAELFPEGSVWQLQMAVVYALATRNYRDACEAAEKHGVVEREVYEDWLRADATAAGEWLKLRWLEVR
jgi:hypothetical protein